MVYDYVCNECSAIMNIELPIGSDLPKEVSCNRCGGTCKHDFLSQAQSLNSIVPEHMKATSRIYTDNFHKGYKKDASVEAMESKGMF